MRSQSVLDLLILILYRFGTLWFKILLKSIFASLSIIDARKMRLMVGLEEALTPLKNRKFVICNIASCKERFELCANRKITCVPTAYLVSL